MSLNKILKKTNKNSKKKYPKKITEKNSLKKIHRKKFQKTKISGKIFIKKKFPGKTNDTKQ